MDNCKIVSRVESFLIELKRITNFMKITLDAKKLRRLKDLLNPSIECFLAKNMVG